MADFAKRPEVTVNTMGRVQNPTGEGVRAISTQVQAKTAKLSDASASSMGDEGTTVTGTTNSSTSNTNNKADQYETKVKEGTAKRNITRKKTADRDSGKYNSMHKKQGGHGKGQWKEEIDPALYAEDDQLLHLDENDPIYDEIEDSNKYILTSIAHEDVVNDKRGYDPGTSKAVYGPLLTCSEFKVQVAECIKEYYDSGDADEVIRTLEELGCKEYHSEIVKKAVSLALDKGSRERELTSRLLTCLMPTPLSHNDMQIGFENLLDSMDDLCTDVPEAKTIAANFLARAVVDEVLPPKFLSEQNNSRPGDEVIEKAVSLLSREHCNARLERVWGPGDGRPVEDLKKDMDQLLKEYLLSRELDEAARCVQELEAPHFHHELVKRGVFAAMEIDGADVAVQNVGELANIDAMAALFGFLVRNSIVSEYQVAKGVSRLHAILSDIALDVPTAPKLLEAFEKLCAEQGCLSAASQNDSNAEAK